ncbi:MAG: M23 family peptidase [Cyanobacteria bacterium J083]|nr:MAG: M23 family peptidase [Cyanobacteria bacterium J083]
MFLLKIASQLKGWQTIGTRSLTTLALVIYPTVAKALEVTIKPPNPQLGDTISVFISTDNPNFTPTLTFQSKTYPVFSTKQANRYRALIPTTPLNKPGKLTLQVQADNTTRNIALFLKNRSFPTQRIRLSPSKSGSATQLELDRVAKFKQLVTPQKFWQGAFLKPNKGRVSTVFGVRRYYNGVFASGYYHRGVDYAGNSGSLIIAPAAGKVMLVGREKQGFKVHGNTVGIDHGQGVLSIFLHMRDIYVQEGDFVQAGQKIGTVGSTGASTGPHLHWGLYVNGISVDPVPWRFQGIE